jgi:hypothetical protein
MIDTGPSKAQWQGISAILALVSVAGWVFLASYLNQPRSWDAKAVLALAVGVLGAVFSACCAIIVALKSSETRIRRALSANASDAAR